MADNNLKFPKKPFRTFGGVHAPHRKNTSGLESVIMPPPQAVLIPMVQHIGAPCNVCVKVGDEVCVGTVIGNSDSFVSAPIHSSVSGKVTKIIKFKTNNGGVTDAVVIESDGLMKECDDFEIPVVTNISDLARVARKSGLVGLGGAGFPTHVKLNVPEGKSVDTLIINCAECEPYITADHREALENSWDVFTGIYTIAEILKIERVIIAVENNKPDVIAQLKKIADTEEYDPKDIVRILTLKASYPQGAEKVLVKACTNRVVPMGKLPLDVGCIVMNIASVAFLSRYMKTGKPLVAKRITVDGSAIKEPKNVIAPIGTSVKDIIDFCGGYKAEPKKILLGGPMMGTAVTTDDTPILKSTNAVLAFDESEARLYEPTECIHCGRCVEACPMHLLPPAISDAVKKNDVEMLNKLSVMNCMECGCCAFSCPANRFIVQNMRLGKAIVKSSSKKN